MTALVKRTSRAKLQKEAAKGISSFDEALKNFDIDFKVEKKPLTYEYNGKHIKADQKEVIIRTDNGDSLGIMGGTYPSISPRDKFQVFSSFADEGLIEFVDGGLYGKWGGKCFLQARIKGSLNLSAKRGEIIEQRISFLTSYDGAISNEAIFSSYRLACENGQVIPEHAMIFKYKSTPNFYSKIDEAIIVIESALNEFRKLDEVYAMLMDSKPLTTKEVESFVDQLVPSKMIVDKNGTLIPSTRTENRKRDIIESIYTGIGQDEIPTMNLWKVLNGVTYYTNHVEGEKKRDTFEHVYQGSGLALNTKAYDMTLSVSNGSLALV